MKAQLISNGWWQADLRILSAPAFLLKVENVYTLVNVALPPKIILYCCDPFHMRSPPPGPWYRGGVPQTYPTYVMFAEGRKEGVSGVTLCCFI